MNAFIGHISAATFWRTASDCQIERIETTNAQPSARSACSEADALGIIEGHFSFAQPLDLLVCSSAKPCNTQNCVFHVRSQYPSDSFVRIEDNLFISSPEFSFLEMSCVLSLPRLVLYGNMLCSTYAMNSFSPRGFNERHSVSTPDKIAQFIKRCDGMKGAKNARRACNFLSANTASPAESILATLLSLPRIMGGYGLPRMHCNYQIPISAANRNLTDKQFFVADYCWPDKRVIVEYDSDAFHTGSARIAQDSKRRNALETMGWRVISITNQQLHQEKEMDRAAQIIADALGVRLRTRCKNYAQRKTQLSVELLSWMQNQSKVGSST